MEKNTIIDKKKTWRLCFIVLIISFCQGLFFSTGLVLAGENDKNPESKLDWILKTIKEKEKGLKTLSGTFRQTKKTSLLKEPLYSEGKVYFDSTGKLLFEVTSPSPLIILMEGDRFLIHYPDLLKTEEISAAKNSHILKTYFGIGRTIQELKKRYDIRLITGTDSEQYHLRMIPKKRSMKKYIDFIDVAVNPENWLPETIDFREKEGDQSSIELRFNMINEPLPKDIFRINMHEDRGEGL